MKQSGILLLFLVLTQFAFAQDPNLLYNEGFEDEIEGTWLLGVDPEAQAGFGILEEIPSWTNVAKLRMQVSVSEVAPNNELTSVYLANESLIALNPGDSCFLSYYCRSTPAGTQLQPFLYHEDAAEGEDKILEFESITLATGFNGMKKTSVIVKDKGNYKLRLGIGGSTGDYVFDNIILKSYDYNADGAPVINSFEVKMEQQGEQGVNQIIGRVEAFDVEGDEISYEYTVMSGGGSITPIDELSFIYEEEGPGEVVFKVTATDSNGNSSSKRATYTVDTYEISELYFNKDVWELVRAKNGYTTHASFGFTENNPDLPNVLLFGTSISIGYTPYVRTALNSIANVYRIPDNGGSTLDMLDNYQLWLGDTHWDVIHFNWGLHDLKYLLNNSLNVNGTQVVPVDEYAEKLEAIIGILSVSADKLVFATTSYVPNGAAGRVRGEEEIYNDSALAVMSRHPEIFVDDQFTLTLNHLDEQKNNDVHFTAAGCERQGNQAAEKITEALNTRTTGDVLPLDASSLLPYSYDSVQKVLTANMNIPMKKVSIYCSNGNKVKTFVNPGDQIRLSQLSKGIYVLVAMLETGDVWTQKFIF